MLLITLFLAISTSFASEFLPEASGAAKVGTDLVIAGDEESGMLWVNDGAETKEVKVKGTKWDDMESLATVSEKSFFAMTSQSLTKKGKRRPEREQLFLLEKSDQKISVKKSWQMRDEILAFLKVNLAGSLDMKIVESASPDEGGLNIEGLTYISGKLYAGLRSPVTKSGEAIILEISDAETSPAITAFRTIKLQGNGIRGLETQGNSMMILSGPVDDSGDEFGLYQFEFSSRRLSPIKLPGFHQLSRPESLVLESAETLTFVQDFQEDAGEDVIVRLNRSSR